MKTPTNKAKKKKVKRKQAEPGEVGDHKARFHQLLDDAVAPIKK